MTKTSEPTVQSQVRRWARDALEGQVEVSIPELTSRFVSDIFSDKKLAEAAKNEMVRPTVYNLVQETVAATRTLKQVGDDALSAEAMDEKAEAWASRFTNWMEHVDGHEKLVMEMSHEDLLAASDTRLHRGQHEIALHSLWRRMAGKVAKGKVVSDVYTPRQVDELYERIKADVVGNEGLS